MKDEKDLHQATTPIMSNLNEHFERARRAEPPLRKDDVSSVLSEKLEQRRQREIAHARTSGLSKYVFLSGFGHFLPTLPRKGWIMFFALLTSSIVAITLMLPQSPQQVSPQTTPALPKAHLSKGQTPSIPYQTVVRTTSPKPRTFAHTAKQNTPAPTSVAALVDSLPAPYDVIHVDEEPFIEIADLMKKVVYPEVAKKLGLEGKVNVRALVMPDGSISPRSFVEYSEVNLFDSSALKAMFATTWKPAERGGKRVPCWVSVPLHFRLNERIGTNAVKKAQMLALTDEELKKIGVEQDAKGVLQVLGWDKARREINQIKVSIYAAITPKLMPDSVFGNYVANLRKQGKDKLAHDWEWAQYARGKYKLRGLLKDSILNPDESSLIGIVSAQQSEEAKFYAQLRERARSLSMPRLVTDGHNYRYYLDLSDMPRVKMFFDAHQQIDTFVMRAKAMKVDSATIQDSIRAKLGLVQDMIKQKFSNKDFQVERDEYEQEKSDINKLIGIRIPSTTARSEGDEYLLWYDPTPEFIALLPERYRVALGREVAAAEKYATRCDIPTEAEKKAVAGYFDSWRACDGVLKITSIYPNPADIQSTVRFRLAEARTITLTVHSLNGERLAILEPTPLLAAGEHELPLNFTGRNVGVYLLALTTDKGETAIMRVMIVR
jgi:TonB family protein